MLVLVYLGAIVAANLTTAAFGPSWSIVNSFLLIGLDLSTRDALHDRWRGRMLWPRMLALVLAGGVISFVLGAGAIAVASSVSFVLASLADAVVYHLIRTRPFLVRANVSNLAGAAVDSVVFPTLAFGGLLPVIVVAQFAAKVAGGLVWSLVLNALPLRRQAT